MLNILSPVRAHGAKVGLLAVLLWPMAATLYTDAGANTENRYLAPPPPLPLSWQQFLATPAKVDAWINDHFGMRADLVEFNNRLRFRLFREFPTIQMAAGRNGRVFMAAHTTTSPLYLAMTAVCGGGNATASPGTVEYFNALFGDFERAGLHPRLMIVPSAPAVHSADVPKWLARRCAGEDTAVAKVLNDQALQQQAREHIFYPLKEARVLAGNEDMYPKTWFHWAGPALGEMAKLSVQHFWGLPAELPAPLPTTSKWSLSDVNYLFPGVELTSLIVQPDFGAAGIQACYGPACYPEFQGYKAGLPDVSRFSNPAAPARRLLILSDSFGSKISGWYARHYRTVEQVATNGIDQMSDADVADMKRVLFRDPANTDILFLYHDGGAVYNTLRFGLQRLHPQAAALAAH